MSAVDYAANRQMINAMFQFRALEQSGNQRAWLVWYATNHPSYFQERVERILAVPSLGSACVELLAAIVKDVCPHHTIKQALLEQLREAWRAARRREARGTWSVRFELEGETFELVNLTEAEAREWANPRVVSAFALFDGGRLVTGSAG